ncbi:MAG: HNH endonuclease [Deltaproteobacteria bacterium]|nr:HNH endonuclease [Deltaproteobacteria bacterium]
MLAALKPTSRARLMDLAAQAGLDVSDWGNYKGGPEDAARNPSYCYEWVLRDGDRILLNLWHENLKEQDGVISTHLNARTRIQQETGIRAARAERLGKAVQAAYEGALPVRVVLLDGNTRPGAGKAVKVRARQLDPEPWAVTDFEAATGKYTLTRSAAPGLRSFVDQFTGADAARAEYRDSQGHVFARQPKVRAAALARAAGTCEWCRAPGFRTADGRVYLETHHIVPLSEAGLDVVTNVAALCANHHREAHHGAGRVAMREKLLAIART